MPFMRRLLNLKGLLPLGIGTAVVVGGLVFWLGGTPGDGQPEADATGASADLPGDGSDDGSGGANGNGGGGGSGAAAGGGSSSGGADPSAASGGSDADSGDSAGGNADGGPEPSSFPPPGGLCGPQEFLGGLIPFVTRLGDPNLLDVPDSFDFISRNFIDTGILPLGRVAGDIAGPLSAPATIIGGFNDTYGHIAAELPAECGGGGGSISGDPHILTLDNHYYDFQAVGEYWAYRSEDGSFGVQIRTTPFLDSGRVASVAGVAAQVDGRMLVIDETAENLVTLDGAALEPEMWEATDNGGAIVYLDDGVAVYWPDNQTTLTVSHLGRAALAVHSTVGEVLQGQVSGLMGNVDGDGGNDIALPDGTEVKEDFETIHGAFAEAWRVAESDDWFEGPSVYRADFPTDEALLTSAEQEAAREICVRSGVVSASLLKSCMFDIAVSGELDFADSYASDQSDRITLVDPQCELVLDGERLMEGLGPARLWQTNVAPRLNAEPAWRLTMEGGDSPDVSRVFPVGDMAIVVDTNHGLHVIDDTGTILRTIELSTIPEVEPLAIGDAIVVATKEGVAGVGFDGSVCWHLVTYADEDVVTLGISGDRIIATTEADGGHVSVALAIDPASGEVLWERTLQANVRQFGARVAPPLANGVGYFEAGEGRVVALRLADGELLWTYEPERPTNAIHALAATEEGVLVATRNNDVAMLAAMTGEVVWKVASQVSIPIAMAVGDTHAFVVGAQGTEAIDRASGEAAWINEDATLTGLSDQQPVVSQGVVYVYAPERQLLGLDVETGQEVARLDADLGEPSQNAYESFVSFPVMLGDVLLAINLSGDLEAYR